MGMLSGNIRGYFRGLYGKGWSFNLEWGTGSSICLFILWLKFQNYQIQFWSDYKFKRFVHLLYVGGGGLNSNVFFVFVLCCFVSLFLKRDKIY